MWNEDSQLWEQLENSVKHGGAGNRILVTRCSQNVARIMKKHICALFGKLTRAMSKVVFPNNFSREEQYTN